MKFTIVHALFLASAVRGMLAGTLPVKTRPMISGFVITSATVAGDGLKRLKRSKSFGVSRELHGGGPGYGRAVQRGSVWRCGGGASCGADLAARAEERGRCSGVRPRTFGSRVLTPQL